MIVLTYPTGLGPACVAFTGRERAEQWAIENGYAGRSTLYASDDVWLYRRLSSHGQLPLFPDVAIVCGHFANHYHYRELLKHWSGCGGGPDKMRYRFDDVVDFNAVRDTAFEIVDHRNCMTNLARPSFLRMSMTTGRLTGRIYSPVSSR